MKVSARNQIKGKVEQIIEGAINDEVIVNLGSGELLTSVITKNSVKNLGLAVGKEAIAIIKAPLVILATPNHGLKFSARNQLNGKIIKIETGSVNSVVTFTIATGNTLSAVITNQSAKEMELKEGGEVIAIVKASHVILAVEA